MAKLDDFGRPIYETAEEYNKAHRNGCPRTYDSPEGENYQHNTGNGLHRFKSVAQRHATVQGSKKAMNIVGMIIAIIIIVNMVIMAAVFNSVGDFEIEFGEVEIGTEENIYDEEYFGDADVPLPEGFEKFKYNGYPCTLPATFEDIYEMGLHVVDYDMLNEVFYGEYEELLDIYDNYDGTYLGMIRVSNPSSESRPMMKCTVDYFYIYNPAVDDPSVPTPNFKFGDGLTFESTYEEVESYLGTPYYYYAEESNYGSSYESYDWAYYGEDEIHYVTITFWNGEMSSVSIEKRDYEEKY